MKIRYQVHYRSDGNIQQVSNFYEGKEKPMGIPECEVIVTDDFINPALFFVRDGKLVEREPAPFGGMDFKNEQWVHTDYSARAYRNQLLSATDHMVVADNPNASNQAVLAYRQALRDVPQQPGFPENVVWPELPD